MILINNGLKTVSPQNWSFTRAISFPESALLCAAERATGTSGIQLWDRFWPWKFWCFALVLMGGGRLWEVVAWTFDCISELISVKRSLTHVKHTILSPSKVTHIEEISVYNFFYPTFVGSKMHVFLGLWKIHNSSRRNSYSDQQRKCPKIWKRKKWCVLSSTILLSQRVDEFYEKSIGRPYNAFAYHKPLPNL